jgi:predicted SAM-dependent methyltransferase
MIDTVVKWLHSRRSVAAPSTEAPNVQNRRRLSFRYLRGSGLEIGGLNVALPVAEKVRVTYVDRMPTEELLRQYPSLAGVTLAPVDVVDDGERLSKFADESQDFVIASHFLEHAQDPIGTLAAHLRVLKAGGVAFVVVPNREATFDRDRPATTWDHLRRDHLEGPEASYEDHLREYSQLVDKCEGAALEERVAYYRRIKFSIHFHVWNAAEFRDFLERVHAEFGLAFAIESYSDRHGEMIAVLRKRRNVRSGCRSQETVNNKVP